MGSLTKRFALLGIAAALLDGSTPAQTLVNPEFQLPAIGSGPKHRLLELVRSRSWAQAARLAGAIALAAEQDPQLHYLVGVVLWQQREKVRAIQRFRAAERLGLREAFLHTALGVAYYDAHQFLLFEQQMDRASVADRSDPQPHFYMGRYAESVQGDFAGALRHYKKAIGLDPHHARGHAYLAHCLERLDRRDAARAHYRKSVALLEQEGARFSWPYQGLARLALETEPQVATGWARKAVENGPDESEAHALLARAHDRNGDLPQAIAAASEAVRLNPDHAASHYLLFTAYRKLGEANEARRHVIRFQELKRVYGDQ